MRIIEFILLMTTSILLLICSIVGAAFLINAIWGIAMHLGALIAIIGLLLCVFAIIIVDTHTN